MFYVNNKQVLGIFLNGYNYNYLAYGFGKIIPEDRNAEQLNLELAYKFLNRYGVGYGTVKDGYENALVSRRMDTPDYNGVFHTPFTYYYNGNIILTKNIPVLITDGNCALSNALVYSDMNINGAINYFANNTDFQGHNVNVFPEKEDYGKYQALLDHEVLNNCSNFDLNISTRFSKGMYPTLYNCNNFSGNFRYVGSKYNNYLGFRGFLYQCRDGIFNIDCTNMHGGESDNNVSYYNFSGIQNCENMNVNITGSSWQVWPHDHSFTSNCNINTYNVISGFSYMNNCNFNVVLPKDSNPEMNQSFEFLNNAENCNYNLNALDSNLFNYRSGVGHAAFFDRLNNCNLNLQVNNTTSFDYSFGDNLSNCNIVFDNIKADLSTFGGWSNLRNCNISGNVVGSGPVSQAFIYGSNNISVQLNFTGSANVKALSFCNNITGNVTLADVNDIRIESCNNMRLYNLNNGNVTFNNVDYGNISVYNYVTHFRNVNNTVARASAWGYIRSVDNCYNIYIGSHRIVGGALIENAYNSHFYIEAASGREYQTWRVNNCYFTGFPYSFSYMNNCRFDVGLEEAISKNASYITWDNVWAHGSRMSDGSYRYIAGLRSIAPYIYNCYITSDDMVLDGNKRYENSNNMQTSFGSYYNGVVIANLPIYNMNIKLNVDCNTLNLGVFQAGPPHGFQNATISANTIYAKGNMPNAYVQLNCDTKIYCENFCNVSFRAEAETNVLQPVVLINNYQHSNYYACNFRGGLYRIGRLNYQGGAPADLTLRNGACVFINNALLGHTEVSQNSLLFLGSNVRFANGITVESGGLIVNKANWGTHASKVWSRVSRDHLAWNVWDLGPWGPQSLFDFCINV